MSMHHHIPTPKCVCLAGAEWLERYSLLLTGPDQTTHTYPVAASGLGPAAALFIHPHEDGESTGTTAGH